MSSIFIFLKYSILHPLLQTCNSLQKDGVRKLLLPFASFLLMAAALLTMPLVATMPAYANGTTIDLWQNFPDNQSDNGFFAYGYAPATNNYWLLSDAGSYSFYRPEEGRWNNPHIFKSGGSNGWLGEPWIGLMPSGTNSNTGSPEDAVLAWAVSTTGSYQLNGSFYSYPSSCSNGIDAYIKRNNITLWASYLPSGTTQDFGVTNLSFDASDTIYFGVDAHNDNGFSECDDWAFVKGQIQIVSAPALFGGTLKLSPSYEFTLEQGTQKTDSIQLINPGTVSRSATLEVVNPHADDLTVSLTEPNPISIAPGETETLPIVLNDLDMPVGVYDDLLLKVAVDDGSTLYASIKVRIVPPGTGQLPDLSISANDIGSTSNADGTVTLTAAVHNQGLSPAANVHVQFYEFNNLLDEPVIAQVSPNGSGSASITVPALTAGDHLIRVVIDPAYAIQEVDENNNQASQIVQPGGSSVATEGNILVSGSLPSTVYTNSLFTLSGRAVYDLIVNSVRNTDYVVKGGSVQITVKGDGGVEWVYGDVHTDVNGNLAKSLQAPATPGTYHIAMTVTDKTVIGKRDLVFKVIERPPVGSPPPAPPTTSGIGNWTFTGSTWIWTWTTPPREPTPQSDLRVFSENIHFSNNHPAVDEEITVFAEIRFWATSTDLVAKDVPINIYVTYPGISSIKIGSTLIDQMSVGSPDFGSRYVYATWKNRAAEGIYLIEFEIDPAYVEENRLNNAATRAIIVGQLQSPQGAISGQVTDSWGTGIGNVILQVTDASGTQLGSAATDPGGFYLVQNVPLGETQVRIETPNGYQPDAVTKTAMVADSSVSNVDFLLTQQVAPPADTIPPVLTLPADITAEATGPAGALVTYTTSAIDGVDGVITPICAPASGSTFALGATSVVCSATDLAGNTASGSFNVTVRDTIPPTLVCPADIGVVQGQQPNLGTPMVSDIVDTALTLTNNAPANYPVGTTAVIWSATDDAGNQASCTQQMTVSPLQPVKQLPVADAGPDRIVRQGSLVTLTGSGSDSDNGPSPLTFLWSQTGGGNVTLNDAGTSRPTFTPSTNGSYAFQLIVNDGADNSEPDEVQITVPLLCDIDLDGDVDRNDINLITAARNQAAVPNDLRDYDGDGKGTVNDARSCVLRCTRSSCAPQ
jgi:hypothetical protein